MTLISVKKVRGLLKTLLERHSLGVRNPVWIDFTEAEILVDASLEKKELKPLLEQLKEKGLITDFAVTEASFCDDYSIFFPENFRRQAEEFLKEPSDRTNSILFLEKNGDFWHTDRERFNYPIIENSKRFLVLKYLIENTGWNQTRDIAVSVHFEDTQRLRNEISKIKTLITKHLQIKGTDLIESKPNSGYRISTKYKIILGK